MIAPIEEPAIATGPLLILRDSSWAAAPDWARRQDKLAEMLTAASPEDYRAAVHALDRILTAGRYVIPAGYSPISRLAHDSALKFPAEIPVYGDYPGFLPETWWREDGAN